MKKVIAISYDEIAYDPKAAGKLVRDACLRNRPMTIVGNYVLDDKLLLFLEEGKNSATEYIFSKTKAVSEEDAITVVEHRYVAGYSTLLLFRLDDSIFGLFRK
jgi:predicted pyridoxine 5'-phosphate oxidase superfamily flavin-nucleotide-binding protein